MQDATSTSHVQAPSSIRRLRGVILASLVVGVGAYTAVMFTITDRLAERFGPQVRVDLEWRVQRGAQELVHAAELGLAMGDRVEIRKAFGAYAQSDDVQAIVAVDGNGVEVTRHGSSHESTSELFSGAPGKIREGRGVLVSWASAEIEGLPVGKIAVVVSTRRMQEAQALLRKSSSTTVLAGVAALVLGALLVLFFTRAVALRDAQLSDYATNLERKVDERTRELDERNAGMRLVLDNVAQGFITVGIDGVMYSERSAIVDRWFGAPIRGGTLSAYLSAHAPAFGDWLDLGLEQLRDGLLPRELVIDQLPKRFTAGSRTYDVVYQTIGTGDTIERLLVIISDATELVAKQRVEREQRELVALFQQAAADRVGVQDFLSEADRLVAELLHRRDPVVQKRLVHTLKGNCASYGLESIADLAHGIEDDLAESGAALSADQRRTLADAWRQAMQRVRPLVETDRSDVIEIERQELATMIEGARAGASSVELAIALEDWEREPVKRSLQRVARPLGALARRQGKPEPTLHIQDHGLRLDSARWSALWAALVHAVRNAIDHGIEDVETRTRAGKPAAGRIELAACVQDDQLVITVQDDGRGIDWTSVRAKAAQLGIPHTTQDDLVRSLLADGLSTKDDVSAISGRGVGLSALDQVVRDYGGRMEVASSARGTAFRFIVPEGPAQFGDFRAKIDQIADTARL
jgi:two-component system chemotaxis sensor kinase CheA